MMSPLAPIRWVDAQVTRAVCAAAFWHMRLGTPKSTLRFVLGVAMWSLSWLVPFELWRLIPWVLITAQVVLQLFRDVQTEDAGAAHNEFDAFIGHRAWRVFMWTMLLIDFDAAGALLLLYMYLALVPFTPPPAQQREPALRHAEAA